MHYTGQIYRPPIEAHTPLLEVTAGCSYNRCAFCTMYDRTPFDTQPEKHIIEDLRELAAMSVSFTRLFLLNGDPFILPAESLLHIADLVHYYLPHVNTITCYCSIRDLKRKSPTDLRNLRVNGFNELYIGLETGYERALEQMDKGCTVEDEWEMLACLKMSDFDYHAIIMDGIAGRGNTDENVHATAALLNAYKPASIALMSTTVMPGSRLERMRDAGEFEEMTEREKLEEEIALLEALRMEDHCLFFADHAFSKAPVRGYFRDKERIIAYLRQVLSTLG